MTIEERIEKLSQAIHLAKNECHVPSGSKGGQFCSGGGGGGAGVSGSSEFASHITSLVQTKQRDKVKAALGSANSEQLQRVADSLVRQGHDKSSNPEIKHLWGVVQSEAKSRGARRDKEGYYNF